MCIRDREEPERLAEVKGISERKAQEIAVQMEEKKDLREALVLSLIHICILPYL